MSYKEAFLKANIQGIIALIIVCGGLYLLHDKGTPNDVKMVVGTLMGAVVSHYFNNNPKDKTLIKDK